MLSQGLKINPKEVARYQKYFGNSGDDLTSFVEITSPVIRNALLAGVHSFISNDGTLLPDLAVWNKLYGSKHGDFLVVVLMDRAQFSSEEIASMLLKSAVPDILGKYGIGFATWGEHCWLGPECSRVVFELSTKDTLVETVRKLYTYAQMEELIVQLVDATTASVKLVCDFNPYALYIRKTHVQIAHSLAVDLFGTSRVGQSF